LHNSVTAHVLCDSQQLAVNRNWRQQLAAFWWTCDM
jgi:hypothetical protein